MIRAVSGLIIWSLSYCRSMMGLVGELKKQLDFPVDIVILRASNQNEQLRSAVGFSAEEFKELLVHEIINDWQKALEFLNAHQGYHHLFCAYQKEPMHIRLIKEVMRRKERFGILSEAPCVMTAGFKGWLKKNIYLRSILPHKIREFVCAADFIVNLSGNDPLPLQKIGWKISQIIPFGYYPPPIPSSHVVERTKNHDFHILVSGIMTWHRAPDVVMDALVKLKSRGISFRATFTQDGPLRERLVKTAQEYGLSVDFPGCLPLEDLIRLYETCSVYVGAGRSEPWGMRLNDALNCGAPLVVSRGMGGVAMVDDYGCGLTFPKNDAECLANQLYVLATDSNVYGQCARQAICAATYCSPENKASELITHISSYWLMKA